MLTLLTLLLGAHLATSSLADSTQTLSGVTMPDTVTVNGTQLVLNGMALRKKMVFKVYVAGLYLPARNSDPDAILGADAARRSSCISSAGWTRARCAMLGREP
jgi:hypothetical protein